MARLTEKQRSFIGALLARKTYAEAYAEAYPKSAKASRKDLDERARKLLRNPVVQEAYSALLEARHAEERERVGCQREDIIENLKYTIESIRSEIARRESAIEREAELLGKSEVLTEEEAELSAARARQKAVLTAALTGGLVSASLALAKILGYESTQAESQEAVSFEGESEL